MGFVAGIGELLWDIFPAGKELGGAPGNFAWHVHALGLDAEVISRVGNDDDGRGILDRLRSMGLGCDLVGVDPVHSTGRSTVSVDSSGVPSFVVHDGVAWDFIEFTPALARAAAEARAVNFGTLGQRHAVSRATTGAFLGRTPPGTIRLLDLNLRPPHYTRKVIEAALSAADVLKLNDSEMSVVARMFGWASDEAACARWLVDAFELDVLALTRGQKGSTLFAGGRTYDHPGFDTEVVDTVGAGDAFAAALVVGLLSGLGFDVINAHANRVASYVCSRAGATPELPIELMDFRP
jgi:fructokinase